MRSLRSVIAMMFAAGLIAACGQNNSASKSGQTQTTSASQSATGTNLKAGKLPKLRIVCANDIAKYCQADTRIQRCLRQNMQNLAADCQTALQEIRAAARERRMERMKANANNGQGGNGNNSYIGNGNTYTTNGSNNGGSNGMGSGTGGSNAGGTNPGSDGNGNDGN